MGAHIALCALLLASSGAAAQDVYTVAGIVRDTATRVPLAGALVAIRNGAFERAARANQHGEFRISAVPTGNYHLNVRRIGYVEAERAFQVLDRDVFVTLGVIRVTRELDTVRVRERVMAIFGVIGAAQGVRPLADVKVQVIGINHTTMTDSAGRFFVEVKMAGRYLVRVSRTGFTHLLLSVDVAPDVSAETSALLDSTDARDRMGTETAWKDFDKRVIWRGPRSAIVSAAELDTLEGMSLGDALNHTNSAFRRGMRIGSQTCVFVNGVPMPGWPVDAYPIARVDAVELYGPGGDGTGTLRQAWPPRVPCGLPQGGPFGDGLPAGTAAFAVIWLKPNP